MLECLKQIAYPENNQDWLTVKRTDSLFSINCDKSHCDSLKREAETHPSFGYLLTFTN